MVGLYWPQQAILCAVLLAILCATLLLVAAAVPAEGFYQPQNDSALPEVVVACVHGQSNRARALLGGHQCNSSNSSPNIQTAIDAVLAKRANAEALIRLVLMPQENTRCRIPLRSDDSNAGVVLGGEAASNMEITTITSPSCSHAVLDAIPSQKNGTYITIFNTNRVVLHGLKFIVYQRQQAVSIERSSLVLLKDCVLEFHSWRETSAIRALSSLLVMMIDCDLVRGDGDKPDCFSIDNVKSIKSPVAFDGDLEVPHSNLPPIAYEAWVWLSQQLEITDVEEIQSVCQVGSQFSWQQQSVDLTACDKLPFLVVIRCDFKHLGVVPPYFSQLDLSLTQALGSAIQLRLTLPNVSIPAASTYTGLAVIIAHTSFVNASGPESSAVAVHFASDRTVSNWRDADSDGTGYVAIRNCTFHSNEGFAGGALSVKFDAMVSRCSIDVFDSVFSYNRARQGGGAVYINFKGHSQVLNCVAFTSCSFHGNSVGLTNSTETNKVGGAVAAYAQYRERFYRYFHEEDLVPSQCKFPLHFTNANLTANKGFGAVFSHLVSAAFSNATSVLSTRGTGLVVLRASFHFHQGPVLISGNSGMNGGGLHISEFGSMNFKSVVHGVSIRNNSASKHGGGVFMDVDSSSAGADEAEMYAGQNHTNDRCPILLPNATRPMVLEELFNLNSDQGNRTPAVSVTSWHKCYSWQTLHTLITLAGTDVHEAPYCLPYPPAEWSIVKNRAQGVKGCQEPTSKYPPLSSGNNSFLNQPDICYSTCQNFIVFNKLNLIKQYIQTAAAWIVFRSSSASCYKRMGGRILYFREGCYRENIYQMVLSTPGVGQMQYYDCTIYALPTYYYRFRASLTPVLPGYKFLLTPWGSLIHKWHSYSEENLRKQAQDSGRTYEHIVAGGCSPIKNVTVTNSPIVGELTLNPAPGENFDLELDVLDEFLGIISATLRIRVKSDNHTVLLGVNGIEICEDESIAFPSRSPLKKLFLSGLPGSRGHLFVDIVDTPAILEDNMPELVYSMPFVLADCLPGFREPIATTLKEVQDHVSQGYCKSQHGRSKLRRQHSQTKSPLVCQCPTNDAIKRCPDQKTLLVLDEYWAGDRNGLETWNMPENCVLDERIFFSTSSRCKGDGCCAGRNISFAIGKCENGHCSQHGQKRTVWRLSAESACKDTSRVGTLCTRCKEGYRIKIATESCHKCDDGTAIPLGGYFVMVFLASAAVFAVMLYANIGVSTTLASWSFFIQAVIMIFPDDVALRTVFYSTMTLGFGHICTRERLTPLQAKSALFAHPLFMFLFMFLVWLAIRRGYGVRYLQHLQKRHTLAHVVWLCVLYCSITLAYAASSILSSVMVTTPHGDITVLFIDGSVEAFSKEHAPFAALAILVMVFMVLPPPLVMAHPHLRSLSQFKWFADKAMSIYEDKRHMWAAVDLSRRLLLACLLGGISNMAVRRCLVAMSCVLLLAAHIAYRPFKRSKCVWRISDFSNRLETVLLADVSVLAVARLAFKELEPDSMLWAQVIYRFMYIAPTVICLVIGVQRFYKSWYDAINRNALPERHRLANIDADVEQSTNSDSSHQFSQDSQGRSQSQHSDVELSTDLLQVAEHLREPLLIDHLMSTDEIM